MSDDEDFLEFRLGSGQRTQRLRDAMSHLGMGSEPSSPNASRKATPPDTASPDAFPPSRAMFSNMEDGDLSTALKWNDHEALANPFATDSHYSFDQDQVRGSTATLTFDDVQESPTRSPERDTPSRHSQEFSYRQVQAGVSDEDSFGQDLAHSGDRNPFQHPQNDFSKHSMGLEQSNESNGQSESEYFGYTVLNDDRLSYEQPATSQEHIEQNSGNPRSDHNYNIGSAEPQEAETTLSKEYSNANDNNAELPKEYHPEPEFAEGSEITQVDGSETEVKREVPKVKAHYHQNSLGQVERIDLDEPTPSDDGEWEPMPTVGSYEVYDDSNNLLQEVQPEETSVENAAASGYTRVANDDETASITSLDDKTDFLFARATDVEEDLDATTQGQTTKEMLTDTQRIAYVGLVRLVLADMGDQVRKFGVKKGLALESLQMWGSKLILRLYTHMDLNNDEQLMIEQLAAHGVYAQDLAPSLKVAQKVQGSEIIPEDIKTETTVDDLHASTAEREETQEDTTATNPGTTLHVDVRWTAMCDLFIILVTDGVYDARSRALLEIVGRHLGVTSFDVCQFERKVTEALQLDDAAEQDWTEQDIIEARRKKALRRKYAYMGLATIGGGLVIGLSSGLLAPVIGAGLAAGLTTIGISGTSGFLAGTGGIALVTTAGTAIGAGVSNRSMGRRMGHVKTFELRPLFNNRRVNTVVTVSGWMTGKNDDVRLPFSTIDPVVGDVLGVLWEPEMMRSLGQTINILATEALAQGVQQILAATVLTALLSSLQLPMWLSKLSYFLDNPWSVSLGRAWAAGQILADVLMQRNLGERPVTLVGFSLGSRVIYSCLVELAKRNAYGLVQDVYVFGMPVFYSKTKFAAVRSVVAGRFVSGFSRRDWILAFLFPASRRYGYVLGLDPIPDDAAERLGVENVDVTDVVDGHMAYRNQMPKLLRRVGWPVLSEEFDEIDDPDPDQLRDKQRKLLSELETKQPAKKSKGFWPFRRRNVDWLNKAAGSESSPAGEETTNPEHEGDPDEYLFDMDAVRDAMRNVKPQLIFDAEAQDDEPNDEAKEDEPPRYSSVMDIHTMPELVDEPEEPLWHPNERVPEVPQEPKKRESTPPKSSVKLTFADDLE